MSQLPPPSDPPTAAGSACQESGTSARPAQAPPEAEQARPAKRQRPDDGDCASSDGAAGEGVDAKVANKNELFNDAERNGFEGQKFSLI